MPAPFPLAPQLVTFINEASAKQPGRRREPSGTYLEVRFGSPELP
jgi:hypothetical protein